MKRKITFFFLLILPALSNINAQDYAIAVKAGTMGVNFEIARSFGEHLNMRVGAAYFAYSLRGGEPGDDYLIDAKAKLLSGTVLADYYPFGSFLRLTGGLFINFNEANLDLTPAKSHKIGGDEYTPDKLGTLQAQVKFERFAPYMGIGFGNPTAGDAGLKFTLDIGAVYQGPAKVDLTAEGLLEPSAAPDQEKKLMDNISWFKWYPVLSLGFVYKF